jgi:hypothetical protein
MRLNLLKATVYSKLARYYADTVQVLGKIMNLIIL